MAYYLAPVLSGSPLHPQIDRLRNSHITYWALVSELGKHEVGIVVELRCCFYLDFRFLGESTVGLKDRRKVMKVRSGEAGRN